MAQPDRMLWDRRQGLSIPAPHLLMQNYLEQVGLWYVANILYFEYDSTLISALACGGA